MYMYGGLLNHVHHLCFLWQCHQTLKQKKFFPFEFHYGLCRAKGLQNFKSVFVRQLKDNPTLSNIQLTKIKDGNQYMQPKPLIVANHDGTILNIGCDYGMCFLNTYEAKKSFKKKKRQNKTIGSNQGSMFQVILSYNERCTPPIESK